MRSSVLRRVVSGSVMIALAAAAPAQNSVPGKAPNQPAAPVPAAPVPATNPTQPVRVPGEPAPAASPDAKKENAATAYEKVWEGPNKAIFDANFLRTMLSDNEKWLPDEDTVKKLEAAQADIESLLKISKMEFCDWNIRTKEEGFDAKVPHWTKLQMTFRVLFADSRRLSNQSGAGDAAAAERVAAIIRLSQHFKNDKLIGAVRTGRHLAAIGMGEAQRLAKARKLDETTRKSLLDAIKPLDNTDPLGMKDAILNESVITREWTKRICVGPDAAKTFITKFAPKAKQEEIDKSGLKQMDEATLHRQVESLDLCYKEVVASWDLPNAGEAIKSIDAQRKNGDYGGPAMLANAEPGFAHHRSATYKFVQLIVKETIKSLNEATVKSAK